MSLRLSSTSSVEYFGDFSFEFLITPILTDSNLVSSIQATGKLNTVLSLSCKWYRITQEKMIQIPDLTNK